MDIKRENYTLRKDQRGNPLLWVISGFQSEIKIPTLDDSYLLDVFDNSKRRRLKTWLEHEVTHKDEVFQPHLIGVCKKTPLHIDPGYQRYTHQLVLRCDNLALSGWDRQATRIQAGDVFSLDTHSPHELVPECESSGIWYCAVSIDSGKPHQLHEIAPVFQLYLEWLNANPLTSTSQT